jgi:NADH-quinone oxidoreductase subunit L
MMLGVALLLVFCGAVGKSAQVPLHVWLPDAMEGPTPVSALIHAATMVAAGVYMLLRISPLLDHSPLWATDTIAWVGLITAIMAALIAIQQDDIKRVLAYSTLSQLGYMVMAVGLLAGEAAMFHLYTHAFFKALLFLGAGAVIHAMHHEQDIWKMGGLAKKMPLTTLTFVIGTLALAGVPMFSGAFSKHDILAAAHDKSPIFFWMTATVALLTTYYMSRLVLTVFLGKERSTAAAHAHEAPLLMSVPLVALAVPSVVAGYPFFKKAFPFFAHGAKAADVAHHGHAVPAIVDLASWGAIAGGFLMALALYWNKSQDPIRIPIFAGRFYIDSIYKRLIQIVQDGLAALTGWVDRWLIDGVFVRGLAASVWLCGFVARFIQVGNVQAYSFLFGAGIVIVLYLLFNL